jgi:hypothetical protein
MTGKWIIVAGTVLLAVAGCGGESGSHGTKDAGTTTASATRSGPTSSPADSPSASTTPSIAADASSLAGRIKVAVPSVTKVVRITENNDPNDMIGRPNGYTNAAVLYDKGAGCTELGVDCGATIEVWPTAAEARARAAYIQGILQDAPVLGTEYDYLNERALLRVDGVIKPSTAGAYAASFGGHPFKL